MASVGCKQGLAPASHLFYIWAQSRRMCGNNRIRGLATINFPASALNRPGVALAILYLVGSTSAASQHLFMHPRDESNLSIRSASVDVAHNKPVQLVIIIACIILFAMLASTIACFYRMPKTKEEALEEEKEARKNSWSPSIAVNSRQSDVYSVSDVNGMDSKRNSNGSTMSYDSFGSNRGNAQGYGVRKQMYGNIAQDGPRGVRGPTPGPRAATFHSQGFTPSNLRHSIIADDLESAEGGMSRRPSFIDRALAHRAGPHDARLPSNQISDRPLPLPPKERKTTGGSLLSALSSGFKGSRENTRSSRAVDSDFEGTIGGRDGEIPMAKRSRDPRSRFPCDTSTAAPTPIMQAEIFNDRFSPLQTRCSVFADAVDPTPRSTPGLAGVGTTMATLPAVAVPPAAMGRVRSFADLQRAAIQSDEPNLWRTQASMDDWIQSSQVAERPPMSRKGTNCSFMTSASLKEGNGAANVDLERMKSIQPRFAPTTTLASWLNEDDVRDVNSVIGGYLVEGDEGIESDGKSQLSSEAEYVIPKKVNLWEGSPHRHSDGDAARFQSQRQIQRDDKGRAMSADAANQHTRALPPVAWGAREEDLEEQKRQIDRRQAYLLREKKKSDRRLIKLQREKVLQTMQLQREALRQSDDETTIAAAEERSVQIEQESRMMNNHFILQMEEAGAQVEGEEENERDERMRREEHLQMRNRLRQSVQLFHAPMLGQQLQHQQQRVKLSKVNIPHRAPMRAPSLSPPESPLTSASEGSDQYFRPKKGNFLVHSRKNSQGTISMTHRSISHSSSLPYQYGHTTQQIHPEAQQSHARQMSNRCVSEHRPVLYY